MWKKSDVSQMLFGPYGGHPAEKQLRQHHQAGGNKAAASSGQRSAAAEGKTSSSPISAHRKYQKVAELLPRKPTAPVCYRSDPAVYGEKPVGITTTINQGVKDYRIRVHPSCHGDV